jgi:phosphonate transport system substrate-binding protein
MGREIELVQRRTYQEITGALLDGSVDAAWTCGYPYCSTATAVLAGGAGLAGRAALSVLPDRRRRRCRDQLADLQGGAHAFSDPDSNSGYLVTASDLARIGTTPDIFFSRSIFTYGHRNVVRAVAGGLTRSGSVDGYVWEVLNSVEPGLTARTRVISRSEDLGFPPFVARSDRMEEAGSPPAACPSGPGQTDRAGGAAPSVSRCRCPGGPGAVRRHRRTHGGAWGRMM